MFDIGFWELLVIFALALMVLGPDKLPGVARTVGQWMGRARAMARSLRIQIEQEIESTKELAEQDESSESKAAESSREIDETS